MGIWTEFVDFLRRQHKTYREMLTHAQRTADDHLEDMRCQIVASQIGRPPCRNLRSTATRPYGLAGT